MFYSDDPLFDFYRHDAEQEAWLAKRPKCADCCEHVQDDHFYLINDEVICPDCLESHFRKDVEDFYE